MYEDSFRLKTTSGHLTTLFRTVLARQKAIPTTSIFVDFPPSQVPLQPF